MHKVVLKQIGGSDKLSSTLNIVNMLSNDLYPEKATEEIVEMLYQLPNTIAELPTLEQAISLMKKLERLGAVTTLAPVAAHNSLYN